MSLSSELRAWTLASAGVFALSGIGWKVWTAPKVPDLAPTLDAINRPCGLQGKPCGTLADLNRTFATVRGAVGTVETAGRHYDKQLSTLDKQEATLFQDIHGTAKDARGAIADVRTTVNTANNALGHVAPVLDGTTTALASVQSDTDALHTRLTDPRIDSLMDSLNSTGRNVEGMTGSGAGILDDGHKLADHYEKMIDNPKLSPWYVRWLPDVPRVALQAAIDYYTAKH
jgi:hypothetical protein